MKIRRSFTRGLIYGVPYSIGIWLIAAILIVGICRYI